MPLQPDQTLSHYRLLQKIGEGGMGVVYVAWDSRLKRKVALKVLPDALGSDPARLERFQREAEAVARLNHAGIVTIHSVEESEGVRFLTMELVEGERLDKLAAAGPLPLDRLLEVGIALADALSAAHERGIVHRDLKPANVMLTKDGRVKVLDFGLAKLTDAATGSVSQMVTRQAPLTREGGVAGTVPYMSPEQVRGEPVDHRTDIFSLGVVLYELATGLRPFAGNTSAELVSSILRDHPVPLTQRREGLPPRLGRIVERCRRKDLRERFQSARDVCNDLGDLRDEVRLEARAGAGAAAAVPPLEGASGVSLAGSRRSLPRGAWAGIAAGALLLTGTVVVWQGWNGRRVDPGAGAGKPAGEPLKPREPKVASIAVLPFVNMSGDKDNEYFSDGMAEELLNALAKNPALRVAARTSSFSFKGKEVDIAEIGRRLNVASIVEGSVRKQGDQVRITVQLVSAADGYHIWSETYDRRLENIFEVQDDITRSVMSSLRASLPDAGGAGPHTGNTEAYNLILRAEYFLNPLDSESLEKSRDLYKQALTLEPGNARAWVGLGWTYGRMIEEGKIGVEEGRRLARDATERALALDDSLAGAHAQRAWQRMANDWDWPGAEAEVGKAMALDPRNLAAVNAAAVLAGVQGRSREQNEIFRQYLEIDPLNKLILNNLAAGLIDEGRLDEALANARMLLDLDPQHGGTHTLIGRALLAQGKIDAALQEIQQERSRQWRLYGLVLVYQALGRKAESDAALAEYMKLQDPSAYQIACLHAVRGELDEAFQWLDRAYAQRDISLMFLKTDQDLKSLRSDPRWLQFLRKMRLSG